MDIQITAEQVLEVVKAQRNNALDALAAQQAGFAVLNTQCDQFKAIAGRVTEIEAKLAAVEKMAARQAKKAAKTKAEPAPPDTP